MALLRPDVLRPSQHQLVIRYSKEAAWLELAFIVWLLFWWFLFEFHYREVLSQTQWFVWIWIALPIVLLLIGVRYLAELLRRCQRGDTFLFDSYSRTVTRNGNAMRQTVSKVIFRIYRSDRRGHDSFTGRLVLDDGKKIDFATMRDEKLVDQLTKDVADFFGKKVEIEYRSPRHNEVKSLDLTERDIDRK